MKNAISIRQICFILFAYGAATKLLLYPSVVTNEIGNAIIFSTLFNFAVQSVIIWATGYLCSRTDKTFFQLLSDTFGKVTAKIIYALFALYFLLSAIVPLNEQQVLVQYTFYDTMPTLAVFLPIFVFLIYAGVKSFTNVGRCADICFPVFLVTVISFLIMSVGEADFTNLLPIMQQPVQKVASQTLASSFRFTESAYLLMFMGHFKYKKGDAAKMTVSYVAGGLLVIAFVGTYYALYGVLAPTRALAISNISLFFPVINFVGRIDLFIVYLFDLVVLFAIALNIQCCVYCICKTFDSEKRVLFSVGVNAVLIAITFLTNLKHSLVQQAAGSWFWIAAMVFAYLIPLLAWALKRRSNETKNN